MSSSSDTQSLRIDIKQAILEAQNWFPCSILVQNRENIKKIYQDKLSSPCKSEKCIFLTKRIGEPSLIGQVYKYSPPEYKDQVFFAIKFNPYSGESKAKSDNELAISLALSETGSSLYPHVYGYGICEKILPGDKPGMYMVFELLAFTFGQMVMDADLAEQIELTNQFLTDIMVRILKAIQDLNEKQGYTHGDLHAGNIMFRCVDETTIEPVIIDFGRSRPYKAENWITDYERLLYDLKLKLWNWPVGEKTVNDILNIIGDIKTPQDLRKIFRKTIKQHIKDAKKKSTTTKPKTDDI